MEANEKSLTSPFMTLIFPTAAQLKAFPEIAQPKESNRTCSSMEKENISPMEQTTPMYKYNENTRCSKAYTVLCGKKQSHDICALIKQRKKKKLNRSNRLI